MFCTVNGITIPVASGKGDKKWAMIGDRARAFDGTLRESRTAERRSWDLALKPSIQTDADAYSNLIRGSGHSWSFDVDLFSSKGLNKKAQTGTVTPGVASGKFSNKVQIAAVSNVTWAVGLTGDYTLIVWRLETAVWHQYVIRKTGGTTNKWKDAVQNDGVGTTWLTVSGTDVVLGDVAVGPDDFDDLVVLPYSIPTAWVSQIYNSGVAWTPLPKLGVNGTMTSSTLVTCIGLMTSEPPEPFASSGWQIGGRRPEFQLEEV